MAHPLLMVDGRERRPEEIMIIAARPGELKRKPGQAYHEMNCRACGTLIMGDDNTLDRAQLGCLVFCPPCGVHQHPRVHAGYDRDTGERLTVGDFARRPDLRGGFRD
jgi:hypothetical protein